MAIEYKVTQALIDDLNANNTTLEWYQSSIGGVGFVSVGDVLPLYSYITFRAKTGYKFVDDSVWYEDTTQGVSKYFFPLYGNKTESQDSVNQAISQNAVFNFETISTAPPTPIQYTVTQALIDELNVKHATLEWYDPNAMGVALVSVGSVLPTYSPIVFRAIDGYKFVDGGVWIEDTTQGVSRINFDIISGGLKADGVVTSVISSNAVLNFDTYTDDEPVEPIDPPFKGYNNVYKVTDEQAKYYANKRFYKAVDVETIEITNYIIGLVRLPFTVDDSFLLPPEPVKIDTIVDGNAVAVSTDVIVFNMGSISIPNVKDNFLDFKNTLAILHIPYSNPVNLDINYVIGHEISIDFIINLYDGLASVNIKSNRIDSVVDTLAIDLDINIPFANPETSPSNNRPDNIQFGIQNGVKTPFIEILRNDAILENGFFTIPIVDESLLSFQNGFIKIDEIDLNVNAGRDEKEMILNAMSNGVIIK